MTGEQIVDFSRVSTRDAGMIEYVPMSSAIIGRMPRNIQPESRVRSTEKTTVY